MAENETISVMRRKAGAGRPPPEIDEVTVTSILGTALAQAAQDVLALNAAITSIGESRVTLATFCEDLPQNALLVLCKRGPDELGMVVLDQECLAAFIEIQTIGQVSPSPAALRAATRTDALLCAGFLDQVFLLFEQGTQEVGLPINQSVTGYRYAAPLADLRAVEMKLADCPYRLFSLQIDLANGAKSGQMRILLPLSAPIVDLDKTTQAWETNLANAINCAQVEIDAVLARKELQLSEIAAFKVGSIITIPTKAVGEIVLTDMNGASITLGRLGQAAGFRAICITHPCTKAAEQTPSFDKALNAPVSDSHLGLKTPPSEPTPSMGALPNIADTGSAEPNPTIGEKMGETIDMEAEFPNLENA